MPAQYWRELNIEPFDKQQLSREKR
uniref:Uncharacterized protein n=1 Tax=Amphimedon queenslandica TaxID=400682 RepID=A0A1X7UKY9_AMPQE